MQPLSKLFEISCWSEMHGLCVCLSVCWSHWSAMQKRLNWSRCHLGNTLVSRRNNISHEMQYSERHLANATGWYMCWSFSHIRQVVPMCYLSNTWLLVQSRKWCTDKQTDHVTTRGVGIGCIFGKCAKYCVEYVCLSVFVCISVCMRRPNLQTTWPQTPLGLTRGFRNPWLDQDYAFFKVQTKIGQILVLFGGWSQVVQKFSIFTPKGTSLPESASCKPFCVTIHWGVWPPWVLLKKCRKSQNLPLEWCVAVNTGFAFSCSLWYTRVKIGPRK